MLTTSWTTSPHSFAISHRRVPARAGALGAAAERLAPAFPEDSDLAGADRARHAHAAPRNRLSGTAPRRGDTGSGGGAEPTWTASSPGSSGCARPGEGAGRFPVPLAGRRGRARRDPLVPPAGSGGGGGLRRSAGLHPSQTASFGEAGAGSGITGTRWVSGNPAGMHGPMLTVLVETLELAPTIDTTVWESLALANAMTAMATNRRYAWHAIRRSPGVIELTAPGRSADVAAGLQPDRVERAHRTALFRSPRQARHQAQRGLEPRGIAPAGRGRSPPRDRDCRGRTDSPWVRRAVLRAIPETFPGRRRHRGKGCCLTVKNGIMSA